MKDFSTELTFKTSRSSGAGGQNVNKVETSVTVMWKVSASEFFSEEEKELISQKLKNRINLDGILQITVSDSRTQLQNRKIAVERITELVNKSLIKPKPRKSTKPSKAQIEKRLDTKKKLSAKKDNRRFRPDL
ncbi:aminoacyl-tRNA hydrolase [Chryseobacterium suipulveris]|uniref:Aminoacyl-tRNA hydrolase n=1 Tax=Chryseobacterium suipulveris TaxID=2929800 RepID=A0ABY4BQR5_9FLAO|nr:alternative ribosome rescue aminoacyl-tRNA hydrolase ArfB [Chryseobacterium suipulveris]UOE41460.1 aminoacyl-tRNA hydrolase [Chryseobacterium suipulveris]